MSLTPADRQQVEAWWREVLRGSRLPTGLEPVQTRLIRSVGRGRLPGAGPVYVKVMTFPRFRDRLRYSLRTLPARHEAAMLAAVSAAGIPAPEVLAVRTARHAIRPRASMLVLRALPADDRPVTPLEMAAVAKVLAGAGILHPDLHPDNFVALAGGGVAVLDLHSARLRRPLPEADRLAMAAKLLASLADADPDPAPLVQGGLLPAALMRAAQEQARRLRRQELLRRIRRCMTNSSGFRVRRGLRGTLYERRGPRPEGRWLEGGDELARCWVGDRTLEVLEGRPPLLFAFHRKSWWFPGLSSVYTAGPVAGASARAALFEALLEGHDRYLRLVSGTDEGSDPRPRA